MAGENEPVETEQTDAEAIAAFTAGTELRNSDPAPGPTTTPDPDPAAEEVTEPAPKPFNVSEQDWNELSRKATAIDEIKAENKRQFDSLNGNVGGMKQILDQLRNRGGVKLSPGQLKRTAAEFPALEALLTEDLNEILSAPGGAVDAEEIDKRARALMDAELPKVRADMEKKILRLSHRDWVDVVRSDEFKAYQQTLPPEENAKLLASNDGEFLADHITEFKKRKAAKPAATPAPVAATPTATPAPARQKRIEAAIPARGTGGTAPAPDPRDEFNQGYALKGTG